MKQKNKVKIFKLITLLLLITILTVATAYMIPVIKKLNTAEGQVEFKAKVEETKILGILMLFGLELAQIVLAILPGEPIEVLAGICFGPVWGTIFLMISIFIITCMIYFLVKKYGRNFIYEFFPKDKVNKIENSKLFKNEKNIEIIMSILFIVPGTPKDLLVYLGGLLPIKSSRFIIISTLLRFPSIISSTIVGANLLEGKWRIGILVYAITFAITAIIIVIMKKLDRSNITEDIVDLMKSNEST